MEGSPGKIGKVTVPAHADGEDWLSALPDDIVLHIMTFLTTRQAVRTCVLSRRWRNLWRSVPCINIHIHEFGRNETKFIKFDQKMELSFTRFLDKVLKLRDPAAPIHTFCFRFYRLTRIEGTSASEDMSRWISQALQKHARVLDIVVLCDKLELNHSAFACRFLTRIDFFSVIMMQGFFKQLETGCPSLENLSLDECMVVDSEISSRTLKVLTIIDTWFSCKYKTTISTPSVTTFFLWWPLSGTIVFSNMPLLVTSLLVLHAEQDSSYFCQNLRSLSAAKSSNFQFHYYYGKKLTIENNLQRFPKFINLVSLTLGQWCLDANFYGLIVFLRNSPILEKLTLKLEKHRWRKTSQIMIGELEERSFTCEHLTSVKVKCLVDDPLVKGVANFFLKMGLTSAQVHIKHWSQL